MEPTKRPRRALTGDSSSILPDIPLGVIKDGKWTQSYFRNLVRGALRRIYFRWTGRLAALARVRVERPGVTKKGDPKKRPEVWYTCELCGTLGKSAVGKTNPKGYKRVWVDHDPPLVPVDRPYLTWSEYVERLFCTPDKLRVLCDDCHYTVTQEQNAVRREFRRALRREATSQTETNPVNKPDLDSPTDI